MPKKKEAPQPLPCPGYGSLPLVSKAGPRRWTAVCVRRGCPCLGLRAAGKSEKEVIEIWNREVLEYED